MPLTRTTIPTLAGSHDWQPGQSTYNSSGDNDGSGVTQDWYSHTQTTDAQCIRVNNQDYAASTPFSSPTVVENMLQINYTVQTTDEIIYNSNFSGDVISLQKLELVSNTSAGGFGTQATINTSAAGLIRRAARKDENGNILDPSGICVKSGTMYLDHVPGAYDASYDTSNGVNGILGMFVGRLPLDCETFSPTLVDL